MEASLRSVEPAAAGRHVTTRRGFIATCGFAMLGLYGVWAAYEPAEESDAAAGAAGGHTGHGGGEMGMSPDDFRELTIAFIDAYRLPDGSVRPGGPTDDHAVALAAEVHAGHSAPPPADPHAGPAMEHPEAEPVEIFLMASRFAFEPDWLRLEVRRRYRLRLMAMDTAHGASIQLGAGAHVIRAPAGVMVEKTLSFTQPGEYLLYCTVFCGDGHDRMTGRIIVT